ncbi:MAG: ABC transporter ATP-binding protein [candidate division NC10 bacterium]|nr:ABC transporter ATP-binding protein [candidate division NC10 bacterium]
MLRLEGIQAGYNSVPVLFGVDLEVQEGEIVALLGANGAGKSTVLRVITGLLHPSAGRVTFRGEPIHRLPPHEVVRRGVVCVPQRRRIFGGLTARENLELGAFVQRRDREGFRQNLQMVLQLFPHLEKRLGQLSGTLSGGEQQMLAFARGLMAQPQLLMLDEPSLGLAPKLVAEVYADIRRVAQAGKTVLIVEQNARAALSVANRGYVLENGKIVLQGLARDLIHNDYVRRTYLAA